MANLDAEKPTRLGQLIEELKRLQIEYGDVPVYVRDIVNDFGAAWPEIEVKEVSGKLDVAIIF